MRTDNLSFLTNLIGKNLIDNTVNQLQNLNAKLEDEFLLTVNQQQINDALYRFVTRNVKSIMDMNIELHEDWFRLYCTVRMNGIFVKVAGNFDLVHIQLDRQRQRLVFAQRGDTEILQLHAKSFIKKVAIRTGVPLYRKFLKHDPLGDILRRINLARVKENVYYIDIGRWLHKNKKIMTTLLKVQVNYALVNEEQLVLKAKLNPRDLLAANASGDIITDEDNPKNNKHSSIESEYNSTKT